MTYVYLALAFAVACLLAYVQGRSDGGNLVTAEYATRDLADERANQAAYASWNARNRAKEAEGAKRASTNAKAYQKELANAETAKIAALGAVRNGALRLRLTDPTGCEADRGPAGSPGGTGRGNDGGEKGRFLGETDSAFLIAEASRADAIVHQLASCQAIVRADREQPSAP